MTNTPASAPTTSGSSVAKFSLFVSGIFHPLLLPTYIFLLLMAINPYLFGSNAFGDRRGVLLLIMIFLYTFVIPAISIAIMRGLGMVQDLMMPDRMQRIGPLLMVMILYFWVYYNFSQDNDTPDIFNSSLLGVVIALALSFTINVVDKISLHAVGMGGLVGTAMIAMGVFGNSALWVGDFGVGLGLVVVICVLLAGMVGTARLALGVHTHQQLLAGYLVGFVAQWVALNFYF